MRDARTTQWSPRDQPMRTRAVPTARPTAALLLKLLLILLLVATAPPASAQSAYSLFEAGPVRPLAFSPNGQRLFVVNTPDAQLDVFRVDTIGRLTPIGSVPVGLEPVAVSARNDNEVWVVNHLSDSVSIVDVSGAKPRVVRTLLVGDEPNDIVFAGPGNDRAFISAAHRGQNAPVVDGDYDTPGIGRADVFVFDAANLGTSLAGNPLTIVTLFGDRPRALARNAAGDRVYAAVFRSGNRTTPINELAVCDSSAGNRTNETVQGACLVGTGANITTSPGGLPTPLKNHAGVGGQETGLIVRQDRDGGTSGTWQDELGRDWSALVRFELPDQDVFTIDASAPIPVETARPFVGVGTSLFNMAVHPQSGRLFVSNTEAMNHVRFEGPGTHVTSQGLKAVGGQTVKLDACATKKVPAPSDVTVTLYVGPGGKAQSVGFAGKTVIDDAWAECAAKAALALRLPDPKGQIAKLAVKYRTE